MSDIHKLYVAYFGRPLEVLHTQTIAEMTRSLNVIRATSATPDTPHWGPSAKDARRAQIKRNGGKR